MALWRIRRSDSGSVCVTMSWSLCSVLFFTVVLAALPGGLYSQSSDCVNPRQQPGLCVALSSCPSLVQLVRVRPVPAASATFLRQSQCGYEGREPKVCCPDLVSSGGGGSGAGGGGVSSAAIPNSDQCGEANTDKIFGGTVTDLDEFPWTVLLEYTRPNGKGFYCGGVLITPRYVLSAAHCIRGTAVPRNWRLTGVRMGEWNTSSEVDCSSPSYCSDAPVDVPVERVIVHEQYVPTSRAQQNDIALIRLARPVQFSEWIKPICIPLINARVAQKSYVGEELFVAGWGRTETKSESDVKLKLRVPVVAESQCSSRYQSLGVNLERTQICAGGRQGQDSCRGDSGGPLMVLESDGETSNWYVIGLVSFGPTPCGMQGWPGVYTNVAQFTNWLRQNIRD